MNEPVIQISSADYIINIDGAAAAAIMGQLDELLCNAQSRAAQRCCSTDEGIHHVEVCYREVLALHDALAEALDDPPWVEQFEGGN